MPVVLAVEEALAKAAELGKKPHLLMGNGFSRACLDDVFAYEALLEKADFSNLSASAWEVFDAFGTTDFEAVMRGLLDASRLVVLYDPSQAPLAAQMEADAAGLREVLIQAIAKSHPDYPGVVSSEAYKKCRAFLARFDRLYTLNYDLLLYWALMQSEIDDLEISSDDGFRKPDGEAVDYVTWDPDTVGSQDVYYLHGGLHLFDAAHELQKYTWVNTGVKLIDQIRSAMEAERFPLFVAEGDSSAKLDKIRHSGYLSRCERSLYSLAGTLFLFGWSIGPSDAHMVRAIHRSKVRNLFVSARSEVGTEADAALAERAAAISSARPPGRPLAIHFYSADSAHVWS